MPASPSLPFDLQTEQDAITRKQQLIQALMGQSMQGNQGQMVSGHFVAPSPLQTLAQLATTFLGAKSLEGVDNDKRALAGQYNTALASGLQKYLTTRDGAPGEVMSDQQAADLMNNDQAPTLAEPVKPDPRRAAVEAATSGLGPLQQIGMTDFQQLGKNTLTAKDYLGFSGFDPKSRLAAALGGGVAALTPEQKEHVVNGQVLVGTPDTGYKPVADARDKFGPVGPIGQGPNGEPIYGQLNQSTGKADFAPKGVQVNVNTEQTAGTAFAKELGQKRAEVITKSYDNALAAKKAIDALEAAEDDMRAGIKSGASAQIGLGISKWAKSLGIDADPQIANTEAFRANMARETLNLVKGLGAGTGISNADREFAEKASGGSILLDDGAMYRLMNIAKAAAANVQMEHIRLLRAQEGATGAIPQDLATFNIPFTMRGNDQVYFDERTKKFAVRPPARPTSTMAPAATGKTPAGVLSVDEWLTR